jgi:hypothetical protein
MELEADGGYLIVDNDDGDLFKVGFQINGEEVTYGEPSKVKVQYVAADRDERRALAASVVEAMASTNDRLTVYATRAESRPVKATEKGGSGLDTKALAKRLGLPEDATEEQIEAKLGEVLPASPADAPETPTGDLVTPESSSTTGPAPENPPAGLPSAQGPTTTPPDPAKGETDIPQEPHVDAEGRIVMDAEQYQRLMASAESVAARDKRDTKAEDERTVQAAIGQGRIPPSRKEHYLKAMEADREGTRKLLTASVEEGGLAPDWFPWARPRATAALTKVTSPFRPKGCPQSGLAAPSRPLAPGQSRPGA